MSDTGSENNTLLVIGTGFVIVVKNFLGNHKAENYPKLVPDLLLNFQNLGATMSIKVHYFHNHLDKFPENLGNMCEEQSERFHQEITVMEVRYQGRWDRHNGRLLLEPST